MEKMIEVCLGVWFLIHIGKYMDVYFWSLIYISADWGCVRIHVVSFDF